MINDEIKKLPRTKTLIAELAKAAETYRSTRRRRAIHDFLTVVYGHYWGIKKSPNLKAYKSALKTRAELSAKTTMPLSGLLLRLASADIDRRDLHRWKTVLEEAYAANLPPKRFKKEVIGLHGINGALAHWKTKGTKKTKRRPIWLVIEPARQGLMASADAQVLTREEHREA